MCGIAGYIHLNNERETQDLSIIKRMTDVIAHRGPDGEGSYLGENFVFGHRRLAIVDLSDAGHQPMVYLNRYVITYNGEIYNYPEIKEELIRNGYVFFSNTDTEVIMAAYDFWGVECLQKFNGMWAFVIYDKKLANFFISRDRFGIKPLYYINIDGKFVFSSEIKAISAYTEDSLSPNVAYLKQYLKYGPKEYISETAFSDVFRFPHASYFLGSVEELNHLKIEKFWRIKSNVKDVRFCREQAAIYAQQYYDLLYDAVKLRLRADVKVGSALSGGLDSSSIVYLVNQQLRELGKEEQQETFSSVYKTKGTEHCDESTFIDLLAQELNVRSNQIEPKENDIPAEHEKMIWSMENPPESSCMSGWHTFKKVSESNVIVTLDGQGADEQLAGYVPYIATYLTSLPIVDFYKEIPFFTKIPGAKKYLFRAFIMNHFKLLFGEKNLVRFAQKVLGKKINLNLNVTLEESINSGLLNLIHYSDHVSMGHSIESRMPFMDYRLVEFLASVPACYKMHNGWTKYIARMAFNNKLPDDICWRVDKMGWPIPEEKWFNGGLNGWMNSRINNSLLVRETSTDIDSADELTMQKRIRILNISVFDKVFFK
ncbi:asparagine synthase (glutamine-hydrolyzing) [uncultured Endozoicomonas sp.]|uniref:asparagine synthase (glutamine-hydrolyzing) n=1 Tax=uncultured Endozoicomonas sp. TaxID=432652 RepID=UPI0026277188|nr:asparagine synthase (glutamine-hydrolyzing) [uncultured Endozoicomonas sp.]